MHYSFRCEYKRVRCILHWIYSVIYRYLLITVLAHLMSARPPPLGSFSFLVIHICNLEFIAAQLEYT